MSEEYEPGLVSVVIPTYNRAQMVTEAMDSVWNQTHRPIELIVVDDGSTDNTREVVQEWGTRHGDDPTFQLRYFYQENRGAPAARNLGLIESRGEYIQFLDSDDLLVPGKVAGQIEVMRSDAHVDYVYGKTVQTGRKGECQDIIGAPLCRSADENILSYQWCVSGPLYRRQICLGTGPWDESLTAWQDEEYGARVKAKSQRGCFQNCVVSFYRMHGGLQLVSQSAIQQARAREKALLSIVRLLSQRYCGSRRGLQRCGAQFAINAARYAAGGDLAGFERCLARAETMAEGLWRLGTVAFRIAARLVSPQWLGSAAWKAARWRRALRAWRLTGLRWATGVPKDCL